MHAQETGGLCFAAWRAVYFVTEACLKGVSAGLLTP